MPLGLRLCLFFIFLLGASNSAFSQSFFREIGFQNDNDVYLMTRQDQYYTNGINFYYKKAADSLKLSEKFENKIWTVNLGQKLYNASEGAVYSAREVDRPITGYTFIGGKISWFTKQEEVFSLGTEVAIIGSWALGKNIQEGFHRTFRFYEINGWEYQLNNSIGIDAQASYSRLFFRNKSKKLDAFIKGDLSLGLNNTRLSASTTFRWGRVNQLFESVILGSRIQSKGHQPTKELYLFYKPQIDWVLYNSTIQGGLLIADKGPITFDIKPVVFSQVVGFQFATNSIGMNFSYTFNTKDVKSEAASHQYGTLSLAYYF